jgi:hypothetical protein
LHRNVGPENFLGLQSAVVAGGPVIVKKQIECVMELPWQRFEGFSGATAVGSLVFIDLALIADAFADNLFPTINAYSQTPTWAIVVAVPFVALTYLLGVISISGGAALLAWGRESRIAPTEETSFLATCNPLVASRFQQLQQEAQLLSGSFVAFTLLSFGSAFHAAQIPGWRRFLISVVIAAAILSTLSLTLALQRFRWARDIANAHKSDCKSDDP